MRKSGSAATDGALVEIKRPQMATQVFPIIGKSPLMMNPMTKEDIGDILNPKPVASRRQRVFPTAEERVRGKLGVVLIDAKTMTYGIKGAAFHAALINAARFIGLPMTVMTGLVRVTGPEYLELIAPPPVVDVRMAFQQGKPMPACRPRWNEWEVQVPIRWDNLLLPKESLVALIQQAGDKIGVGSFRPQCKGTFGTFSLPEVFDA